MKVQDAKNVHNPLRVVLLLIIIAFVAFFLGLGVRGFIAYREDVFYQKTMLQKIPEEARSRLLKFENDLKSKRYAMNQIDSIVNQSLQTNRNSGTIKDLIDAKEKLNIEIKNSKPPIKLEAFYLGDAMLLWPWVYTCLGWMIFIFRPPNDVKTLFRKNILKILLLAFLLFAIYRWPTYARNFLTGTEGQKVFGAATYNVSVVCFYTQEVVIFIFMCMISTIWYQWIWQYQQVVSRVHKYLHHPINYKKNFANIAYISYMSRSFIRWQINSVVLAIGFLYYTNVFWQYVIDSGDNRYLLSAFIVHFIWGITWLIISLPLIYQWFNWHLVKMKLITIIFKDNLLTDDEKKSKLEIINSIKPMTTWNVAGSSAVGAITFLLPIINGLVK